MNHEITCVVYGLNLCVFHYKFLSALYDATQKGLMYRIQHILGCLVVSFIVFPPILEAADELNQLIHASEANITGKLIIRQMEGDLTLLRKNGVLATDIPTDVLFEYTSPWHTPDSARLTYTWDLGNGESVTGRDPLVHCSYKVPGNYTLKLRVGASGKHSRVSSRFTKDIQVLDAIKSIKFNGPASYSVDQNSSLTLLVGGSMMELYDNHLTLNFTFSSVGTHCLEISAQNDVSMLHISHSIHVQSGPTSHLLFILPCTVVILAILILISVSVCCPQHLRGIKKKSEVSIKASTYTCLEMKTKDGAVPSPPPSQRKEDHPLLCASGARYSI
ncbi:transmembrane protein 130 isoform X2 [Alosa alosa]|uniref:transmembrane protein 130 isoform X2 n=1 Tax=Alosa alosa TaxID=278164 RepID=UPI0020151464|nr:transmembrane protein 130 isoform X2 [Alosa alosa]